MHCSSLIYYIYRHLIALASSIIRFLGLALVYVRYFFIGLLLSPLAAMADGITVNTNQPSTISPPEVVAVVYPKVRHPYNQIFIAVLDGIKNNKIPSATVISYEIEKGFTPQKLHAKLIKDQVTHIIGLGNRGISTVYRMPHKDSFNIVFGVSQMQPVETSEYYAISTLPSPSNLFNHVVSFSKKIKTIHVVYDKKKQKRLVELAQMYAAELNLTLKLYPAQNISQTAVAYKNILLNIKSERDAIWLVNGSGTLDKSILNDILSQAWDKEFVVFSSFLVDVKRGVLFALYMDNEKTGGELYALLSTLKSGEISKPKVMLNKNVLKAINIRTASHLGFYLTGQQKKQYSFIYPAE